MNLCFRKTYPLLIAVAIAVLFSSGVYGQIYKPADNNFSWLPDNNPVSGTKMFSFAVPSTPPLTFSYTSPVGTSGPVLFGGVRQDASFRANNRAVFFNYTTGGAIPGSSGTGEGDYRIHFTQPNPSDTSTKLGNFKLLSMYLAIGASNTSDVQIQGFRGGKIVASATISSLTANRAATVGETSSLTDLVIDSSHTDNFAGVKLRFGSNWTFLDGLRFTIADKNIPLSIDDLAFNFADNVSPGTQASSVDFSSTTGVVSTINWTSGSGDASAVFISQAGSGFSASPTINNGLPGVYTANTVFGSGTAAGTGWSCVYNGTGNSVIVKGLSSGTTYRVKVVSFNGSGTSTIYNTTDFNGGAGPTSNIRNFNTISAPSIQASDITVTPDYTDFRKAFINFTRGQGVKSAIFVKNNTPGQTISSAVVPPDNDNNATQHTYSSFTDSVNVTANARVGSTGWYCVYNNAGSGTGLPAAVNLSRITVEPNQTLRIMVVDYSGAAGSETYNTTTASNNVIDYIVPNRPLPVTTAASGIMSSTATINGTITPRNGNITSGSFTYSNSASLTPALGTVALTPAATSILGSALTTTVSGALSALTPSTTYYYRIAAISNANTLGAAADKGSIVSSILSFTTAPVVSSVNATTSNGYYKAGQVITISVAFTSAVSVTGTPTIALNSGGSASYGSGSGTATLLFSYTIGSGQNSADLDYTTISALALSGGTIKDADNTDAALALPTPGGANSIAGQKDIVIDTQLPQVNPVTISSNNANTSLAKVGDVITVNFTSDETIITPTATIAGRAVSATNSGGNNWSVVYTMTGSDVDGIVSISIPFTDLALNSGVTVTGTTNSSSVRFDKTVPVLSTVTIASNNANAALAKVGDIVTVSFTSNEAIFTPTATVSGNTAAISNTGGNNWAASYTMTSADAEGTIAFSISFFDISGNAGTTVTATSNSSAVRFDKTVPVISTATIASNNANNALAKVGDVIAVSFTSNEAIFTPTATISGNTATISNTGGNNWTASYTMASGDAEGTIAFSISFIDISGNAGTNVTATSNSSAVRFDKTVPTLSTATIASNNPTTNLAKVGDVITVSFTSSESIFTPTATISGNTATISHTGGNSWSASHTMATGDAEGTIAFSISYIDLSGNAGTNVTATSNSSTVRFDKTAPVLSTATIASNNANATLAKVGDVITVGFTSSEAIFTPTATISGNTATISNTGVNNWTASHTMASGDAEGTIAFSISFTDISGNAGTSVTATSNSSAVRFDKTVPTLSTVTIASNNANTTLAKVGDMVAVSFTSNESIFTPTATVAGSAATISHTGGNNWTASHTMASGDTEGTIAFSISFTDISGNVGTSVTATSNSSAVRFDKTVPTISTATIASNNANTTLAKIGDVVTVTFTSSEAIFTPTATISGNTATISNHGGNNWRASYTMVSGDTEGTISFSLSFTDISGNPGTAVTATTNSNAVRFDKTVPSLSNVSIASNNSNTTLAKVGDIITVIFTASEAIFTPTAAISGNAATIANSGGNNWSATYAMTSGDTEGTILFSASFSDISGNTGTTVTTTSNSSTVRFDKTVPVLSTVSIVSNNANTSLAKVGDLVTVSFSSSENVFTPTASIAGQAVTVNNIGGNNWNTSYTMLNSDVDGIISFSISFTDLVGNSGTAVTVTTNSSLVRFDKTAPVLSVAAITSSNANTSVAKIGDVVTINFTSNETIFTPTATIASHNTIVSNSGGNNWNAAYTMTNGDTEGNVSFTIAFTDLSGNTGAIVTTTTNNSVVRFDKTAPVLSPVTIVSNNTNTALAKTGDLVTVSFTASEAIFTPTATISGNTASIVNNGGNNWKASFSMTGADAEGNIPFTVSFIDVSGNAGATVNTTTNSSAIRFDKTIPVLASVAIASNNTNNKYAKTGDVITLSFTGSESLALPVVTVAGRTAAVTSTGNSNWRAVYTMLSTDATGTITFGIVFKDLASNNGVTVTTTSNNTSVIFENRLPLLTTVKIASNNTIDSLAKTGDLVTLSFTSDKTITTPVVTIAGRAAAITNVSANNWIAATAMINGDGEGAVRFAIAVTDLAGNTGLSVTTTSDAGKVLFDRTAPSVVSIVRQSPLSATITAGTIPVTYRVSFSENVKNITPAAFVLTAGGVTTATITSVSATSGSAIDVTVNSIVGNGSIRLDLKNTGTNIIDAAGNAISGGFTTGEVYGVVVNPVSFATAAPSLALCVGLTTTVSLDNLSGASGGDNGQTVRWTIVSGPSHGTLNGFPTNANVNSALTLPTGLSYLPASGYAGNDAFTIQISNGYDSVTKVVNATIHALPVATIASAQGTALCGVSSLTLTASGGSTYAWYNNGTLVPNNPTAQLVITTAGTYHAVATDAIGCVGAIGNSLGIVQLQKPTVDFVFDGYCINKSVTFTNQSIVANSGTVTYAWTDGTNTSANASPTFTYGQTGAQNVKLTVTPVACPTLADNITKALTIETPAAALRMPTQNVAVNVSTALQARTIGVGNTYAWSPGTGLSFPNAGATNASISQEQQYLISITAASKCVTVDTVLLRIFVANNILVPNIFSPNGDGQNDKILPNLVGVKTFTYLRIFNRSGKKVFETNNPGEGWDGKLNGVPQPVDTYFWTASGLDKNGLLLVKQGTFTLIR